MTIKTQITFKDFVKYDLKNISIRTIISLIILLAILFLNLYNAEDERDEYLKLIFICLFFFIVLVIIRTYFTLKKAFNSNKNIQESITYTFTDEKICIQGKTFNGDFAWNSVYKVKENKDWFLIYQNAQVMNMVPKKFFKKDQVSELRNMIKTNKIKAKLRED